MQHMEDMEDMEDMEAMQHMENIYSVIFNSQCKLTLTPVYFVSLPIDQEHHNSHLKVGIYCE